jgi:hypothetical protein
LELNPNKTKAKELIITLKKYQMKKWTEIIFNKICNRYIN